MTHYEWVEKDMELTLTDECSKVEYKIQLHLRFSITKDAVKLEITQCTS